MRSIHVPLIAAILLSVGVAGRVLPTGTVQAASACAPAVTPRGGAPAPLARSTQSFGFRLLNRLVAGNDSNVFISPAGIDLALMMAFDGSAGATRTGMATALGLGTRSPATVRRTAATLIAALQSADPQARLEIANSLWVRAGTALRAGFLRDAQHNYGARVASLRFDSPAALRAINGWVGCATHGAIPTILDRIPSNVILYLLNAVYFAAHWSSPFNPTNTHPHSFTTASGTTLSVPLMDQAGTFPYYNGPDVQAISLAYGSGRYAMTVLLPPAGGSLATLRATLTPMTWNTWLSHLQPAYGEIALPRFSLTNTFALNGPLTALGMGAAFSDGADFLGMCVHPCKLSDVRHKTYLRVDEAGTVAAGVTSVGVVPTSIQTQAFHMIVNRPFLLAIRDTTTGTLLFLGTMNNPG